MSVNEGGLGLQHPRTTAISSYMMSTKRSLQYAQEGVWLGMNRERPMLPTQITRLYKNWEQDEAKTWVIFRKYLSVFTEICFQNADSPHDFINKASMNGSREKAKDYSSRMMRKTVLRNENVTPEEVRKVLPGMLDRRASLALMTMPRMEECNRLDNDTFKICLQRKLRLPIIKDAINYRCKCGQKLDIYGDHCLGCTSNSKKIASDGIRDGIIKVLQRVLPVTKMIKSGTQVEREPIGIISQLPRVQPFDLSIRLDHTVDSGAWRVPYSRVGFDVTIIHSNKQSSSSASEAAKYTESDLRLRDGERSKFVRPRGNTNELTKQTLSADQIIGELVDSNNAFIPIAIGPHGEIGSLFRRFLTGKKALPLPTFSTDRRNAKRAADTAISTKTPHSVLIKANKTWKKFNGDKPFGGTYMSSTPEMWADQNIGLAIQSHLATHIKKSLTKIQCIKGNRETSDANPSRNIFDDEETEAAWRTYNGPLDHDDDLMDG